MATYNEFKEWIEQEMQKRSWRQIDLARAGGIDPVTLNRILSMERKAGPDSCQAIARALGLPPEEVFRRAGLLPKLPEENSTLRRITLRLRELLDDDRGQAVLPQIDVIVEALYRQVFGNGASSATASNTLTDEKPVYNVRQRRSKSASQSGEQL